MGRNKVKIYDRKEMKTTFSDVAGVDEAKEELREIVEFLKNPKKYQRLGGRIPKGVLLLGPPGCGKTLLARAVAGEANVPFFFMSGSEFVEMFVGLGAARVRELFQQAKEKAPALVFLDEIDTIGKGRSGAMGSGFGAHDEREQTLNQLLVEMDGFDSQQGRHHHGGHEPAGRARPGPRAARADSTGRSSSTARTCGAARRSSASTRAASRCNPDVDLQHDRRAHPGFTGADLENVVNEAALLAARRDKNAVTEDELEEAIDRASMGLERKSRVMSEKEKTRVAVARDGPRPRRALLREPRPGPPRHDHPARDGGARPHDDAAARGPVPRDRAGAEGHARVRDGRACRPRRSCSARSRRARRTTSRRRRRSHERWCPTTG